MTAIDGGETDSSAELHRRLETLERELAEYRRRESELRKHEREVRLLMDQIPNLVGLLKPTGEADLINRQILDFTGRTEEQLLKWGGSDLVHPDDLDQVTSCFVQGIASAEPFKTVYRMRRHDGAYRWFEGNHQPLKSTDGSIYRWCVSVNDIDDWTRARDALRESERDLRLVVATIPGLICLFTPDGRLEGANQPFIDYCGEGVEQADNWATTGLVHPQDVPSITKDFLHSLRTGEPYDFEARVRRRDGVYRWFKMRGQAHRDEQGRILRWYGLLSDIEERKRAQDLLAGERQLLEMVASGQGLSDVLGALCGVVERLADDCYCEVRLSDAVGLPIQPSAALARELQLVSTTPVFSREGVVLATLGIYRRAAAPPASDQDLIGRVAHIASIAIERRLAEAELSRRANFLATGERVSLTGSFAWQPHNDHFTCSEQLRRIHEFEEGASVSASDMRARIHPDDVPLLDATMSEAQSGRDNPEHEIRLLMPDGRVKYVRAVSQIVQDHDGTTLCIGAVQDVTRRRLAEDGLDKVRSDLTHLSRVMSLGTLTASIAHEVNQPLSGIVTNSTTCVHMLSASPPNVLGALETTRRTIRDARRAADVIARLRALFARRTARSATVDLNQAAAEVVSLLGSELQRNRVIVQTDFGAGLPLIEADRVQLQQVILNLLQNGCDAMNEVENRPKLLSIATTTTGDGIQLSVKDAGVGYPAEDAEHMFQAFHTSKTGGMGIGLSVSRRIIESHQGRLWCERNQGHGATFSFSLPAWRGDDRSRNT
jgi:PAS domain S-box-containing protein